ncbi:glutathione S-transferase family protein [Roseibium salinum]|uniref:Glutathione S-transferase family protein n=1 Tax=Roseibium salinum TaxID=1604349 RepID=A0ABT3QY83_9HYPH|nr:glutathione S-transferase family protein [Roseibium sp. DSM 29163]MCX2721796.1 glutathione S-transferase family protein [Roseibium sp. DSM 29163]
MLELHYHPLASFCHKVLIPLYEAGTPFEAHIVDLMDPDGRARFYQLWPVGKMPVLKDRERGKVVPESSIIIEYLDRHYPGATPMLPDDPDICLDARLWDRIFDHYVQEHVQKIVVDRIRPEEARDPAGVEDARRRLATAYDMIEKQLAGETWITGEAFTLADAAAAPALFYAGILVPFSDRHGNLQAYFERLLERPSVRRVLIEARPYFDMFPYRDQMPARFLELSDA